MAAPSIKDFLVQKGIQVGDSVEIAWKEQLIRATILPQSSLNPDFLDVKLATGYNTGLALKQIQSIQKIPTPEKSVDHTMGARATPTHSIHDKPQLSLISAGGTIGAKVDYKNAGVSALLTPDELLALIPELGAFAHISNIVSPFSKLSENMLPNDWIRLAQIVAQELQKKEIRGVLLTHGTDTLHYTAAALSFFLRNLSKPVVLVGAQRSSDRGSSDANMNMICASYVAISDIAEVGICMHGSTSDEFCLFNRGTRVKKMHTSRRDAFRPINSKPLAKVFPNGKIESLIPFNVRSETRKLELDAVFEENVALIKCFPGIDPAVMEDYVKRGCKGFILEGTGLGNLNERWVPMIKKLTEKGIPIFGTTQVPYGRTNLNVYSAGRMTQEAGLVGLEDMLPEVAYVKLGWVLAHTQKLEEVHQMMLTPVAGEIAARSEVDTFLY